MLSVGKFDVSIVLDVEVGYTSSLGGDVKQSVCTGLRFEFRTYLKILKYCLNIYLI